MTFFKHEPDILPKTKKNLKISSAGDVHPQGQTHSWVVVSFFKMILS